MSTLQDWLSTSHFLPLLTLEVILKLCIINKFKLRNSEIKKNCLATVELNGGLEVVLTLSRSSLWDALKEFKQYHLSHDARMEWRPHSACDSVLSFPNREGIALHRVV